MFAISSGTETLLIYVAAAVIGAAILGFARAVMKFMQTRQTTQRQEEYDQRTLSEFFFDRERDPKTGVPAKEGWTTAVNKALDTLTRGQAQTTRMINEILREIKPDGNGGHNLRGLVERGAKAADLGVKAAELEVDRQIVERERVQRRDHVWDEDQ